MKTINFNMKTYKIKWWSKKDGDIGNFSFDTETTRVVDQQVPDYILGMAFNGEDVFFITREDIKSFWSCNKNNMIFMANASFDLFVVAKQASCSVVEEVESGRIFDIIILENLISIAESSSPAYASLDKITKKYLNTELPKLTIDTDIVKLRGYSQKQMNRKDNKKDCSVRLNVSFRKSGLKKNI
jgi:hypothetical protein